MALPKTILGCHMTIERGFTEHSETLDMHELFLIIAGMSDVRNYAFVEGLRVNSPIVYRRLGEYAKANSVMTWYEWPEDI